MFPYLLFLIFLAHSSLEDYTGHASYNALSVSDAFCFGKPQGTWTHKSKFQIISKWFPNNFKLFLNYSQEESYRTCQWQCTECVRHILLWQTPGNLDTPSRTQSIVDPPQPTDNKLTHSHPNHALHHWPARSFVWQDCVCTQHPCPQNPHDILN